MEKNNYYPRTGAIIGAILGLLVGIVLLTQNPDEGVGPEILYWNGPILVALSVFGGFIGAVVGIVIEKLIGEQKDNSQVEGFKGLEEMLSKVHKTEEDQYQSRTSYQDRDEQEEKPT